MIGEGYYAVVVNILKQYDFHQVKGGKGSHQKWEGIHQQTHKLVKVTVPFNCTRFTGESVLKEIGIKQKL